jgi:hypothetical protein
MSASDAVDGSSTVIAMCQFALVIQEQRMTGNGTKQSFSDVSQNGCFGVLSGSSQRQCLQLGVKRTEIDHRVFGCC